MMGGDLPFEPIAECVLDESIIDRFNAIVRRFPSEVAIQEPSIRLTYAELAGLVSRIATATIAAAEGRPGPIAILLQASAYLPAAMLGVLAAGRAYVTLDAEFPIERNAAIVADAGACAIVSSRRLLGEARHSLPHELPVIDIDDLPKPESLHLARISPDDIAAIYYTSGSSGQPKSVAWNHRSVVHWVRVFTDTAQISYMDRFALLFSAAVSASWRAIYSSLLNGACLHILPPLGIGLPGVVEAMRGRGITILHAVPALMRLIFEARSDDLRFDTVRLVCIGGDRVEWSDVDQCRQAFSQNVIVYSILTSTEGGPFVHGVTDDLLRSTMARPPAGRAAPGWTVTVINDDGEPASDGELGDIVISSRYIALGYWDGTALQVRAFPTDPTDPDKRVFNTGDRGRRRPDGLIEFVGRNDQQIKLHGHRIEPAEVEAALAASPEVNDAVVVVRRNAEGLPRSLAAYVEPKRGVDDLTPRKLAAELKTRLPRHMIPATIIVTEKLPRLPNLKIDREELRRRDQREPERALTAPMPGSEVRTNTEERLLALWREVLDRQDIGYDDDFFLCGGDSFAAFDLMLRIEREFQHQSPLIALAEAPTVSQLAQRLEGMTPGADLIPIHTDGRRRPLFAIYVAGGHALALLPILRSLGPDQPCYWLQPPGMDWTKCASLPQIATHYVNEAKAVQPHGPYRLLGTGFGGLAAFEMALQLQEAGDPVDYLAILDAEPPTCVLGGRVDVCDSHTLLRALDAQPAPVGRFEAETRTVVEAQIRMRRDHVLDSKSTRDIFRGELTFFHCTGESVVAGQDRRRLWRSFASGFRLLSVPGRRGTHDREPQYTAVRDLLGACLDDNPHKALPVSECDPGSVYDRYYRMDDRHQPRRVLGSMGDVYRIDRERLQGSVDGIRIIADAIQVTGWAVGSCRRQPAQTIAVFLDDQFLGYGAGSDPRPDVAKYLGADSALFCGFDFTFDASVVANAPRRPRLFVLSSDGSAAELRAGIEAVAIGSVKMLSSTEHSGVILAGDWSAREPWGIWSSGRQAAVTFDASSLPDRFKVAIRANLFPPDPSLVQKVRVSDGGVAKVVGIRLA
jgi:amino acid adenylation domain-containing protein